MREINEQAGKCTVDGGLCLPGILATVVGWGRDSIVVLSLRSSWICWGARGFVEGRLDLLAFANMWVFV